MLVGRERECELLDAMLDEARLGRSGALVLRGEPGIGKTALLDYAASRAMDMTVTRTLGVESEVELEFSALLDVCRPLLHLLDELPESQANALRAALGHAPGVGLDRLAIAAGTLGLLAAAAEQAPLLVLVDDAQWVDPASADALLFATRRLAADRVAVLFAARDDEGHAFDARGIDEIVVAGLDRDAAAELLRASGDIDARVVGRLHEATGGNPLALVELPARLSAGQRAGIEPLDEPLPPGTTVERAFARRVGALPDATRTALLVCAATTSFGSELALRALESLGVPPSALEPAEDAGLIRVSAGRIEFRHPLVRAAAYHDAAPSERRRAHRALADAAGPAGQEERAWHLAAAALGPDEDVAAALEGAAEQARRRSGYAAAATALERAARLTPEGGPRAVRLVEAAEAAWGAGRAELAAVLVDEALVNGSDPALRARALRIKGTIEYLTGSAQAAAAALLEAVDILEPTDAEAAVAAAADAVTALVRARAPDDALRAARRARAVAPDDGSESDLQATATLGYALCFAGRYSDAEPVLARTVDLLHDRTAVPGPLEAIRLSAALAWLGRYEEGRAYLAALVARARLAGAVGSLPYLLTACAWLALHASRWNEAEANAGEARELADEIGEPATAIQALGVLTWVHALRGDEVGTQAYGEETRQRAAESGYRLYGLLVSACLGVLHLGAGRVDAAIEELEPIARYAEERRLRIPGVAPQLELAEAYVRAGRSAEGEGVVDALEASELGADPYLAAVSRRCRGLLAADEDFEARFTEALELHGPVPSPFALARTRLCFGERLRRAGRRRDARVELRAALETFERLDAASWAERARSELRSSGERLRRRAGTDEEQLTPQELQIALQVAEGKANKEVAAAMFLSTKTVEFHLSRIYRKLGLASRSELVRRYATELTVSAS